MEDHEEDKEDKREALLLFTSPSSQGNEKWNNVSPTIKTCNGVDLILNNNKNNFKETKKNNLGRGRTTVTTPFANGTSPPSAIVKPVSIMKPTLIATTTTPAAVPSPKITPTDDGNTMGMRRVLSTPDMDVKRMYRDHHRVVDEGFTSSQGIDDRPPPTLLEVARESRWSATCTTPTTSYSSPDLLQLATKYNNINGSSSSQGIDGDDGRSRDHGVAHKQKEKLVLPCRRSSRRRSSSVKKEQRSSMTTSKRVAAVVTEDNSTNPTGHRRRGRSLDKTSTLPSTRTSFPSSSSSSSSRHNYKSLRDTLGNNGHLPGLY